MSDSIRDETHNAEFELLLAAINSLPKDSGIGPCYDDFEEDVIIVETDETGQSKESEIEISCSGGYFKSKIRKVEDEPVNLELVTTPFKKHISDYPISADTINRFKGLYAKFSDQINYRIRFGSAMERAQSLVIKNVAMGAVTVE
jgi:hypothetical protein